MSRDVRRVPLDFDWPLNRVWEGYLMPDELHPPTCQTCLGRGDTGAAQWLYALCYRLGMLVNDVLRDQPNGKPMHPWLARDQYPPTRDIFVPVTDEEREQARAEIERSEARGVAAHHLNYRYAKEGSTRLAGYEVVRPSDDIVDLVAGLTGDDRSRLGGFLGVSSSEAWRMARTIIEAAGLDPQVWGHCLTCGGEGNVGTPEQRAAYESWERTDPPTGEGWQLWESVSEGSPISPVFADREGLIHWLTTDYSWGAQRTPLTREQAESFVGLGHSIGSGVITSDGRVISGEAAIYELSMEA